jgi:hypothetical protein
MTNTAKPTLTTGTDPLPLDYVARVGVPEAPLQDDPRAYAYVALMDDHLRVVTTTELSSLLARDYYTDEVLICALWAYPLNERGVDMIRAEIATSRDEVDDNDFIHFTSRLSVAGITVDQFSWQVDGRV